MAFLISSVFRSKNDFNKAFLSSLTQIREWSAVLKQKNGDKEEVILIQEKRVELELEVK